MAADTKASDYSPIRRERGSQITAETRIAPTCMIWSVAIGIGLLVLVILVWALAHISTIIR